MTIDLNEIKARADAATAGPWVTTEENGVIDTGDMPVVVADCNWGNDAADNAAFISHARADVPALVAEVERLREALDGGDDGEA